jgi:hypothetical protein
MSVYVNSRSNIYATRNHFPKHPLMLEMTLCLFLKDKEKELKQEVGRINQASVNFD